MYLILIISLDTKLHHPTNFSHVYEFHSSSTQDIAQLQVITPNRSYYVCCYQLTSSNFLLRAILFRQVTTTAQHEK